MEAREKRCDARLRLAYPIRVHRTDEETTHGRTVTRNLSARGAYFSTFHGTSFTVGERVGVVISVPHRLADGTSDVLLDLRGEARVVRIDQPAAPPVYGEDGLSVTGVAVCFEEPLRFRYALV